MKTKEQILLDRVIHSNSFLHANIYAAMQEYADQQREVIISKLKARREYYAKLKFGKGYTEELDEIIAELEAGE